MGIFDWIIKKRAKKLLKGVDEDKLSLVIDEYLKKSASKHARTLRDAEKINKANYLNLSEKELRREIREGLEDEDEEEEDEDEDPADQLLNNLITGFIQKKTEGSGSKLAEIAQGLTPEDIQKIKEKFLN